MPSLRQRPDGRFFIDYRDENGERQRPYVLIQGKPCRDQIMAEAYYKHWLKQHEAQRATEGRDKSPRIQEVVDYYRNVYLVSENAATATHAAAETHCTVFLEWCRASHIGRVNQLNVEVLARWSAWLQTGEHKRKPRTTANYLTTIRGVINVALEAGLLKSSPISKWNKPKFDPVEKHPLTLAELNAVIELFSDTPIILWMCFTGQRPSDARGLKFGHVDLAGRTVERPSQKVRALRKFEIGARAAALVEAQAQRPHVPDEYVFLTRDGGQWAEDSALNVMKARCKAAKHPRIVTPIMLRDAFGTILANDIGLPLPELQILMGHTDIKTTMQYVRARGARDWLNRFDGELIFGESGHQNAKLAPKIGAQTGAPVD